MEYQTYEKYLIEELGFWRGEEKRSFVKNAPTLSVVYVVIEITEEGKIVFSEQRERTIIGDVKFFNEPLAILNLEDNDLIEKTKEIFDDQKSLS